MVRNRVIVSDTNHYVSCGRSVAQREATMAKGGGKRGRSAITGKFVKQSTVKGSPKTTVNESTKKK